MPTGLTDLLSLTSHRKVSPGGPVARRGLSDGDPLSLSDVLFGMLGHPSLKKSGREEPVVRRNP